MSDAPKVVTPMTADFPHSELSALAAHSNAWPFVEARALLKHVGDGTPEKGCVLFETGYGPSGLPHIGTFGDGGCASWCVDVLECVGVAWQDAAEVSVAGCAHHVVDVVGVRLGHRRFRTPLRAGSRR